jgi:hypothetical protein
MDQLGFVATLRSRLAWLVGGGFRSTSMSTSASGIVMAVAMAIVIGIVGVVGVILALA